MTSMLSAFNVPALILFDTGPSHSLTSDNFRRILGLNYCVGEELEVSIPLDRTIKTKNMVK